MCSANRKLHGLVFSSRFISKTVALIRVISKQIPEYYEEQVTLTRTDRILESKEPATVIRQNFLRFQRLKFDLIRVRGVFEDNEVVLRNKNKNVSLCTEPN